MLDHPNVQGIVLTTRDITNENRPRRPCGPSSRGPPPHGRSLFPNADGTAGWCAKSQILRGRRVDRAG
jgi:hypothetical protein